MTATTVYQYYAANGGLIYVGVTDRGVRRAHEHAESKPWWRLATGCTLEHYETREAALAREQYLIETFRPPYNTQHNPEKSIPLEVRAARRLGAVMGAGPRTVRPTLSKEEMKARQREWLKLSGPERLVAPCVRCGQRPGLTGPQCINCNQQSAVEARAKRGIAPLASDHRRLHRSLAAGEICPNCNESMRSRPPAVRSGSPSS